MTVVKVLTFSHTPAWRCSGCVGKAFWSASESSFRLGSAQCWAQSNSGFPRKTRWMSGWKGMRDGRHGREDRRRGRLKDRGGMEQLKEGGSDGEGMEG